MSVSKAGELQRSSEMHVEEPARCREAQDAQLPRLTVDRPGFLKAARECKHVVCFLARFLRSERKRGALEEKSRREPEKSTES